MSVFAFVLGSVVGFAVAYFVAHPDKRAALVARITALVKKS